MFPIPVGANNAQLIHDFVARCKSSCVDFCPSDISASEPSSIYFYRIPATGGMRFMLPISFAIEALAFMKDNELLSELLESDISPLPIHSYTGGGNDLSLAEQSSSSFFYSDSYAPYGSHARLGTHPHSPELRTATILRDPLQRLRSVLKTEWTVHGQDLMNVTSAIYSNHSFFANPFTRMFSGKVSQSVELHDSDVYAALGAIKSIDHCFHQENFSPIRHLQQKFLSSNRLPNLVVPSVINGSISEPSDQVMQELLRVALDVGCNKWDSILYSEYIKSSPVDLDPVDYSINSLHPLTFIIELVDDLPGQVSVSRDSRLVSTIDLLLGRVSI